MRTRHNARTAARAGGRGTPRLLVSGLAALLTATAVVVATGGAGRAAEPTSSVQLTGVSAREGGDLVSVLIEASAPASYVATRPDPLTVLVDLRHASAQGARNRVTPSPGGVLQSVAVEQATASDGAALARVRLRLNRPAPHLVRADRNIVRVDFGQPATPAAAPASSVQPAATSGATAITAVKAVSEGGAVTVSLSGNGKLVPTTAELAKDLPPRLVLDFAGVSSSAASRTDVAKGPVQRVRIARNSVKPLVTRVVVDLARVVPYEMSHAASGDLLIAFTEGKPAAASAKPDPAAVKPAAAKPAAPPPSPARVDPKPAEKPAPVEAKPSADKPAAPEPKPAETPRPAEPKAPAPRAEAARPPMVPQGGLQAPGTPPKQYSGQTVSFDFDGSPLRTVLRLFAEISGLNLVIDSKVDGTVDVSLHDVPWDQALEIILRANKLGYTVDGTIVRIAPLSVLADEEKERRRLTDEQALSGELKVLTRTLSYAQASDVVELLKPGSSISNRGSAMVDKRTNTIIVTDLPAYLDKVQSLVNSLDQPETQVEIEARIVRTTHALANQLGTKWGFLGQMVPELGNTTNLAFPNAVTGQGDVNLSLPGTPAGTIKLATGAINGAFNLNMELTALERDNKVKILLTPRVVTQNNVTAVITRGEEIPYQTLTMSGGTGAMLIPMVQFKTAALKLTVTPRITPSSTVLMDIDVDNGSPGDVQENGNRAINTQRAQTRVIVKDGATTVIGGIYGSAETKTTSGVPMLRKIPLLGWLFKNNSADTTDEELLIFITPRIIKMQ